MDPQTVVEDIRKNYDIECVVAKLKAEAEKVASILPEPLRSRIISNLNSNNIEEALEIVEKYLGEASLLLGFLGEAFLRGLYSLIDGCKKNDSESTSNNEFNGLQSEKEGEGASRVYSWIPV